jgi:hypothetical protein
MQKTFIIWCLVMLGTTAAFSQNGYRPAFPLEIGLQIGTSQFLGDLGGQPGVGKGFITDTDIESIKPTFGLFGRYNFGGHFALRVDMSYLQLDGDDKYSGSALGFSPTDRPFTGGLGPEGQPEVEASWFRYYRNLSFRTHVFDMNIVAEIIPYNFELGGGYKNYSVLSPYGFIGIGFFAFNPEGLYNGAWIELRELRTEGQGIVDGRAMYDLVQLNIPMGFGVKWTYNDAWSLALEINHRMTFTDYIDDVSTDYVEDESIWSVGPNAMTPSNALLAQAMARRSGEIDRDGINSAVTGPGVQRGDATDNDSYYTVTVRFSFYIDTDNMGGSKRYGCPVW